MSAVSPKADKRGCGRIVRFVPIADVAKCIEMRANNCRSKLML